MKHHLQRLGESVFLFIAYPFAIAWGLYMICSKTATPSKKP